MTGPAAPERREDVTDEYREDNARKGFPTCDTCGEPAVFSEFAGYMHSTPEHPFGIPAHLDTATHDVTVEKWWNHRRDQ